MQRIQYWASKSPAHHYMAPLPAKHPCSPRVILTCCLRFSGQTRDAFIHKSGRSRPEPHRSKYCCCDRPQLEPQVTAHLNLGPAHRCFDISSFAYIIALRAVICLLQLGLASAGSRVPVGSKKGCHGVQVHSRRHNRRKSAHEADL